VTGAAACTRQEEMAGRQVVVLPSISNLSHSSTETDSDALSESCIEFLSLALLSLKLFGGGWLLQASVAFPRELTTPELVENDTQHN
jgi:hypothetical protein